MAQQLRGESRLRADCPEPGLKPPDAAWLDAVGRERDIVCEIADGCCLRMSPSAYWLFARMQEGLAPDQITDRIHEAFDAHADPADVMAACDGLLANVEEEISRVRAKARKRYAFRIRILPEPAVASIAKRIEPLLSVPMGAVFVGALIASVFAIVAYGPAHGLTAHLSNPGNFAAAYMLFLLALGAHELGHATACSRYRIRPGDIGFALYLVLPAVYCDVTRAWLLPRRQRVLVDMAGLLFEVAAGAAYAITGAVTREWFITLAAFMVLGNLVWALNPFGRFDMYWALSDALGVTNLRQASWRALKGIVSPRERARETETTLLGRWARTAVAAYGACAALVTGWFVYQLGVIAISLGPHLSVVATLIVRDVQHGQLLAAFKAGAGIVLPVVLFAAIYWRMAAMAAPVLWRFLSRPLLLARSNKGAPPEREYLPINSEDV